MSQFVLKFQYLSLSKRFFSKKPTHCQWEILLIEIMML